MKLRDYQIAADEYLWGNLHSRPTENPVVVMPTGTGKSLQMAAAKWRLLYTYPRVRILNLTHVKELVEGNFKTLLKLWPAAPAGVYSAGLHRRDTRSQITFCGIQSVFKKAASFGRIDFVFIDEAHRISDKASAQYATFIADLRKINPNIVVIGFTATPFRMGSGLLTEGELFDYVAFDLSDGEAFVWLINQGYLIRPVPMDPGFQLDESGVHIRGGEYIDSEASQALRDQGILERAVDTAIQIAELEGRRSSLSFCQSIEDAELVAEMFRYKGYEVEAVHSKRSDRDDVLTEFKKGNLWGVTNKDILTTGFDHPPIDLICMLRLTRSPSLWVQMLGRGTRPYFVGHLGHNGGPPLYDIDTVEGRLASIAASPKQTCKVLDFVGNTMRLGPINYPVIPGRRSGKPGGAPARKCPNCGTYHHVSVKVCTELLHTAEGEKECGYEFPPPERVAANASTQELVDDKVLDLMNLPKPDPATFTVEGVHRMTCTHHYGKGGKPDTMRVDYQCGFQRFSTWVCFEHVENSFPWRKAQEWWKSHGGRNEAPMFVEDAVEMATYLHKPKFIKVKHGGSSFPQIVAYDFVGTRFELPPELGGPPLQDPGPDPMAEEQERIERQRMAMYSSMGYDDDIPF